MFDAPADPVHRTYDLMPWDQREPGKREVPFHGMQIRVADAAGMDLDADLARPRFRYGHLPHDQGML